MARSSKSSTTRSGGRTKRTAKAADRTVEDAEIVESSPDRPETGGEGADAAAEQQPDAEGGTAASAVEETQTPADAAGSEPQEPLAGEPATLEGADADGADEAASDGASEAGATDAEETGRRAAMTPVPVPPPPPRRGAAPMILGGIVAAAIGAGALYVGAESGWIDLGGDRVAEMQASIDAQADRIGEMQAALDAAAGELDALQGAEPDLSPAMDAIDEVRAAVDGIAADLSALAARLDGTDARLAEVETQPIPEAELPAEVVEAYERRLAEMQAVLDQRFARMQAAQDEKLAEIEAAQGSAAAAEAAAEAAAKAAEARAALAEIAAALDAGGGYAGALAELTAATGMAAPAELADHAEEGVATLQQLKDGFPPAARQALDLSIRPDPDAGTAGRLGAFLRSQLGVRSLEPREGDDPDAVLSRAEAALAKNDIAGAIDLIRELPEEGQAAFADWIAQAETRAAAVAAAAGLSEQINAN